MTLFELGACDAFVTYEHDALLAQERGIPLEVVMPPRTILASHVAVIVDDNVTSAERPVVRAFVDYLLSDAGQQILRRYHVRPAGVDNNAFPKLDQAIYGGRSGRLDASLYPVGRGFVAEGSRTAPRTGTGPQAGGHRGMMWS